jgi:hypothetical protein
MHITNCLEEEMKFGDKMWLIVKEKVGINGYNMIYTLNASSSVRSSPI